MNDFLDIQISEQKRKAILAAIEKVTEFPEDLQPGDVTVETIVDIYQVNRIRARMIMKKLVELHPDLYKQVYVKLPDTYHGRLGYAIRMISSTPSESIEALSVPHSVALAGS